MNKFKNWKKHISVGVAVCCIIFLLVLISSRSQSNDYSDGIKEIVKFYQVSQDKVLMNRLSNIIDKINEDRKHSTVYSGSNTMKGDLNENEFVLLKPIFSLLVQKDEVDMLLRISDAAPLSHRSEVFDEGSYKYLRAHYNGDNPRVYDLIASWLLDKGLVKSAYRQEVKAAYKDNDYARNVRGLLRYYGCMAEDLVWSELSNNFTTHFNLNGAPYKELSVSKEYQEKVPEMRKALRFGEPPALLSSCPINLYD